VSKQTAIQSLIEDIKIGTLSDHIDGVEYFSKDTILELLERAKETEKAQIMSAWLAGFEETRPYVDHSEDYYNETYESNT
jgi:hypothetical protein